MKSTKDMRVATIWKLCLEMWDWIAERIQAGDVRPVEKLKSAWCDKHGYWLHAECFFCDFAVRHRIDSSHTCFACPGKAVASHFDCFGAYDYLHKPLKFHAKLHRMNRKRLKMNQEKR